MLKRQIGDQAENLARTFLEQRGIKLITKNFCCRYGEIDLIMHHDDTLIFIEVRFRSQHHYGFAEETVHHGKQTKIIRTALYYLQTHTRWSDRPSRFDVIAVDANDDIHWIPDAFQAPAW